MKAYTNVIKPGSRSLHPNGLDYVLMKIEMFGMGVFVGVIGGGALMALAVMCVR